MDKIRIKEIVLGLAALAASAGTFWIWKSVAIPEIAGGDFSGYAGFVFSLAALAASAGLFGLVAMFIRDRRIVYGAAAVQISIPLFYVPATVGALAVLGIAIFGTAFAVRKIRREFSLSLGFSISKILKSGLALYFTVAALIISLFYAGAIDQKNSLSGILPKPAFDFTLYYFLNSSFARGITGLPEIKKDMSADQLLDMIVRGQLEKQGAGAGKIPAADMARLRASAHAEITRQYGISFHGDEKVQDVFYTAIAERTDDLLGPYRRYLPFVSALAFFFALKAVSVPVYLASLMFIWLLIKILISAKVLKLAKETIEVERLTL